MPLLAASRIGARHDAQDWVFPPLDLVVEPGQNTLILGPSGSGKTTLLNLLAGLALPAQGEVRFRDQSLAALDESARDRLRGRHMGFVLQRLHLIASLNVVDNILLAQRLAGSAPDPARARALLARLGLGVHAERMPAQLSQGEAQRVALARALVHRPSLILADEPTSALDDANCAAVISLLLEQAAAEGATLVAATHDARIKAHFSQVLSLPGRA
ncbi:MAG: ATP-binding cassette domain-containing protein [Betaproteobacteria bacterium]|nr:ATP-binding cassette domain-containing protein [Betaproteobacteria bacterium]